MGGRSRPNWVVFEGGPLHGQREILNPAKAMLFQMYRPAPASGMQSVHEYELTEAYRRAQKDSGMKLGTARVARFVRTLADEPVPARSPDIGIMSVWRQRGA